MKSFALDFYDDDVRRKIIHDFIVSNRFFRKLCTQTENVYRFKLKLQKLIEKKNKSIELQFYRDMTARTMSKERINFMLISYRAGPAFTDWAIIINSFDHVSDKFFDRSQSAFLKSTFLKNAIENSNVFSRYEQNRWNKQSGNTDFTNEWYTNENVSNDTINETLNDETNSEGKNIFNDVKNTSNDRISFHKSSFRNLFNVSISLNSYINETKAWIPKRKILCIKCGKSEHVSKNCHDQMLSIWKQSYLRSIVFEDEVLQTNFSAAEYEFYDKNVKFYDISKSKFSIDSNQQFIEKYRPKSLTKIKTSYHVEINLVTYEISNEISIISAFTFVFRSVESSFINVLYEEGFESNKRFHFDDLILFVSFLSQSVDFAEKPKKKRKNELTKKRNLNFWWKCLMNRSEFMINLSRFVKFWRPIK